jgi:hypothetical protein
LLFNPGPTIEAASLIIKKTVPFWRSFIQGVSTEKARASLKPDTRHLKPMLREGFTTPDNVKKKTFFSSIL